MAKRKGILNRLKNIFGITSKTQDYTDQKVPHPAKKEPDRKEKSPLAVDLSDDMYKLYKLWLDETYETSDTLKNRMERYSALEYAYYNNSIISLTADLYADEVPQTESQKEIIKVDAKEKKVRKYILEFFDKIGLTPQMIRNISWNLALYGDAFCIVSSNDEDGFDEIVPIDVYSVKDRFEFKAADVRKKMNRGSKFKNFINSDTRLTALSNLIDNENVDYSDIFKPYLFGFDLGGNMQVPPWNVLHFRAFTTQSEFWPFGRPILINSLAPFRQLQAGKNLMAIARATNFPLRHFKVKTGEYADPSTRWEVVQDAIEEYNNLGSEQSGSDEFAANSSIWTPEEMVDMEQYENRIDLDKIADIEMLRDDLIMGTRVPKGYLIVDKSSFGTSGQSLLRQHKPFARAVYQLQTAILEQLTQLVRLQFAMTGDYDYDTDFELSMNYPMVEESRDRIQTKNDTLRLASDTVDNLGQALGLDRDEALPPEVVKQIFSKLSFLDDEDVEEWVNTTKEMQDQAAEEDEGGGGMFASYTPSQKRIKEKLKDYNKNEFEQLVNQSYFQARKDLKEGVLANSHYYTSGNINNYERKILEVIKRDRLDKSKLKD